MSKVEEVDSVQAARKQWLLDVVGHDEAEVRQAVEGAGCPFRVLRRDGKPALFQTCDMNPDRVNVHVEKGKVVHAYVG